MILFFSQKQSFKMPYEALEARDMISKSPVDRNQLADIVDRLYSTQTVSTTGGKSATGYRARRAVNRVARPPCSEEEMGEIYTRLYTTTTKAWTGGEGIGPMDPPKEPGLGLKMYPVIDGLDTRFQGASVPKEKKEEIIGRLHTAKTKAEQARLDNPRVLLYPERTLLCNNVERINAYQNNGSTVKQDVLERREKWYI